MTPSAINCHGGPNGVPKVDHVFAGGIRKKMSLILDMAILRWICVLDRLKLK